MDRRPDRPGTLAHLHGAEGPFIGGAPGTLAAELVAHQPGHPWPTPQTLLARVAELWSKKVDGGALSAALTGTGSARIELWAIAYRKPTGEGSYLHRYDVTWNQSLVL